MDPKKFIDDFKNLPSDQFRRKLNEVFRTKSCYANLDEKNKKTIFDLLDKHKDKIRSGYGIPPDTLRRESYKLYQDRIKLGLTDEDLKDVKEILGMFKK